jgi:hypothetical protein
LTNVPQALKEAHVSRQVACADAPKHPQIRLEQGEQALGSILVHLPTGVRFLGVIDELVHIALHRPIAAGGVGLQPAARVDGEVGRLLHGLHRELFGRLSDDSALAADPCNHGGPIFIEMPPTGLAFFAAAPWAAPQVLVPTVFGLAFLPGSVIELIRFNSALSQAIHVIGQGGVAQPPAPARAGPEMAP